MHAAGAGGTALRGVRDAHESQGRGTTQLACEFTTRSSPCFAVGDFSGIFWPSKTKTYDVSSELPWVFYFLEEAQGVLINFHYLAELNPMKKTIFSIVLAGLTSIAWANSETKTFTATDESRVKACARAKEDAQYWVRIKTSPPYIISNGTVWKPTDIKYSTCDCGKSESKGQTDCSVDATLSK